MSEKKVFIGLEEGLSILEEGFTKARRIFEGDPGLRFTPEEFMKFYECVYRMCTQTPDYSRQLYDRYKLTLEQCVTAMVLPSLMDKSNEILLLELLKLWSNYQIMVRWLSNFFDYIDRFYICRASLPSLSELATNCFCNLVCPILIGKIRDAVIHLIDQDRAGGQVDVDLPKNVMSLILEANEGVRNLYEEELEQAILEHASPFYSQKASEWLLEYTVPEYLLKVEDCLKRENERLSRYLICELSRRRLLQVVREQMMSVCEGQLQSRQLNGDLALQNYMAINQELMSRCASLTLADGNSGTVSWMDTMEK